MRVAAAVDELERQEGDAATIGLVLCPGRNKTVTQWALRGLSNTRICRPFVMPEEDSNPRHADYDPSAGTPDCPSLGGFGPSSRAFFSLRSAL